jgi:5'-methylthioadenosine phosphorylase
MRGSDLSDIDLGIIGGTGFTDLGFVEREKKEVKTPYGEPSSAITIYEHKGKSIGVLQRHGMDRTIPPHMINHRANIHALDSLGLKKVVGINSVGALSKDTHIPSIVLPDDYIDLQPVTYYDDKIKHIVPGLSEDLRNGMIESANDLGVGLITKGVYIQSKGPRLETKAEIKMMARWGDIVGMCAGSEATLTKELGIAFCFICSVDNYANGITDEPPNFKEIIETSRQNTKKINEIILNFVEGYL